MIDKEKLLSFLDDETSIAEDAITRESYKFISCKVKSGYFDTEYNIVDHLPSILKRIQDDVLEIESKVKFCMLTSQETKNMIENNRKTFKKTNERHESIDVIEAYLDNKFNGDYENFKDEKGYGLGD